MTLSFSAHSTGSLALVTSTASGSGGAARFAAAVGSRATAARTARLRASYAERQAFADGDAPPGADRGSVRWRSGGGVCASAPVTPTRWSSSLARLSSEWMSARPPKRGRAVLPPLHDEGMPSS